MQKHRPRPHRMQRVAAGLALWSMLWLAFLPILHHPAVFAGTNVPMCHMASMADHGTASRDPTHDSDKTKPACPICQSLASMAHNYVPPMLPAIAVPQIVETPTASVLPVATVYKPATVAWPRAPPSLA